MVDLQIADAKTMGRFRCKTKESFNETQNYQHDRLFFYIDFFLLNVHLDGVRRMSLLTGLLLFFSRSFTSLHDLTFENTILDADVSLTGNNNITLNTLALRFLLNQKIFYRFSQ